MTFLHRLRLRARALKYQRRKDCAEFAFLSQYLQPGQCAFDIGAHKGAYMYHMRQQVGPSGTVHVFEPQAMLAHYLRKLTRSFKWKNVFIENCAMSDSDAGRTLYVPHFKRDGSTTQLATVAPENNREQFKPVADVRTDTIDGYCQRHQLSPDFVKIDVEGHELQVLKGARATLSARRVTLLVEIEERHAGLEQVRETFNWMSSLGYQGYLLHSSGLLPAAQFDPVTHQDTSNMKAYYNNFIFLKK